MKTPSFKLLKEEAHKALLPLFKKIKLEHALRCLLLFFVITYCFLLITKASLGYFNDDVVFLRTLQSGKPLLYYNPDFPYYNPIEWGRFTPPGAMEYNIAALFFGASVTGYFIFHAIQFVFTIIILLKILSGITSNIFIKYLTPIFLFLTPALVAPWFQLQLNERNLVFLFSIFIWSYLKFSENQKLRFAIIAFLSATLAIWYKETAFVVPLTFATSHLVLTRKNQNAGEKKLDWSLIGSSLLYLAAYTILVLPRIKTAFAGITGIIPETQSLIATFFKRGQLADPLIIYIALPLFLVRLFQVFVKKQKPEPVFDSLLAATTAYVLAFTVLKIYTEYYLAPSYVTALPTIIYFLATKKYLSKKSWKITCVIVAIFTIINVIPRGIYSIAFHKYIPINFNKTLEFLQKEAAKNPEKNISVFLDGSLRTSSGQWEYFNFQEFLAHRGGPQNITFFRISPELPKLNNTFKMPLPEPQNRTVNQGDYVIVSPFSPAFNDKLDWVSPVSFFLVDASKVFETSSRHASTSLKILNFLRKIGATPAVIYWRSIPLRKLLWHFDRINSPDYIVYRRMTK